MDEDERLISCYWIDPNYRIVKVGGDWDRFARENGGDELLSKRIIGQRLFSYVSSDATRMHLRLILDHVRNISHHTVIPYRCDSPEQQRYMEMHISLDEERTLRLDHYLIRCNEVAPPLSFETAEKASMAFYQRCSMCNFIKVAQQWMEPHLALSKGLIHQQTQQVIYTVCDRCHDIKIA